MYDEMMIASGNLNKVCGMINMEDTERFSKIIFRITKGNCWVSFRGAPRSGGLPRNVFVLVFPGTNNGAIQGKIQRVCESFNASRFAFPHSRQEYEKRIVEIQ